MSLKLLRVHNPLMPSDGLESRTVEYRAHENVLGYLIDARLTSDEIVVSLNGRVLTPADTLAIIPSDGDCLVAAPRVEGGGLFRTLGQFAVLAASAALVASGVGAPLGVGLFSALGLLSTSTAVAAAAVGNALLGAAVSIGGNLLVGAISSALSGPQKTASPTYAASGPHSLAQSGTVIPKAYGTFAWGGNQIAGFIDVEGTNQYINALFDYGFGPGRAIEDVKINGKDITEYGNVQYFVRLGSNDQTPIANFNRIVNGYPQDTQCKAGVPVIIPGTGTLTQALQVDVQFPDGVFLRTNDNNIIEAVLTYKVEYSVAGADNWQSFLQPLQTQDLTSYHLDGSAYVNYSWVAVATDMAPDSGIVHAFDNGPHTPGEPWTGDQTVTTYQPNGNHGTYSKTFHGEWQPADPLVNRVLVLSWTDGFVDFIGASIQVLYNRTSIYGLAPAKYDVRITKYGSARIHDDVPPGDNFSANIGQDMWVHSINEIAYLDLAYPNQILIGVRALATGQLSGAQLNVTATITHGLRTLDTGLLPAALRAFEEDNPACVAADMLLDRLYGGGRWPGILPVNLTRYVDEWVAWAELNDTLVDDGNGNSIRRHVFAGVFDSEGDLWTSVQQVGQMSRASIVPLGRDFGVFVDAPADPVQIFTAGNTVQDSFNETWLELDARANQVEVQFADSTRNFRQDNPLVYMDPLNQDAGVAVKNTRINAKGVTSPARAWHLARYRERANQFLLRSGAFTCPVAACAARPGNVIILQNDMPQWGWGGRTLPESTANTLILDRNDLDFTPGTAYSVIVLQPALLRYTGTVASTSLVTDATGAAVCTQLTLSAFDDAHRVTRCLFPASGADCLILSATPGSIVVQPPPSFTPTPGLAYQLFDTDVLETCTVVGVTLSPDGQAQILALGIPLSQPPQDFSVYFYGPTGSQKLARVANVRRASEFRAKIEWIDYDERGYIDAVPTIGQPTALLKTNPRVSALLASVNYPLVGGSYLPQVSLSWQPGPQTAGVCIYTYLPPVAGLSLANTLPQLVARLTGNPTAWTAPAAVAVRTVYVVVGFDLAGTFDSFNAAPSITVTAQAITANLLLGSSFASGFAYWNLTPRAPSGSNPGDALAFSAANDGQATYTVAGATLTAPQTLLYQIVPPSKWTVGSPLMLSAYFQSSTLNPTTAPNTGALVASLTFLSASGTILSTADAAAPLSSINASGVDSLLLRPATASTVVPAGTAQVLVSVRVAASSTAPLSIPAGSVLTFSHLLLEASTPAQTAPSVWADIDVQGHILNLFTSGSSTGLRVQGSTLPSFTGNFAFSVTDTAATISWTSLVILWPDGQFTYIQDASQAVTGLTAATLYRAYAYYDVVNGGVRFAVPSPPLGTPAVLSTAYDSTADAMCRQDGRVPLSAGGLQLTTNAAGTTAPTTGTGGGGTGTGGSGGGPIQPDPGPAQPYQEYVN